MSERTANRFNWWLPFYGLLGAAIVLLPKMVLGNDIGTFLATALVAAIVGVILFVILLRTVRRQSAAALSMVVVFGAASWLLFRVSDDVRTTGRWLIESRKYKAAILAQPDPANGELKHAEWDGWGFAGSGDTTVYLVFDPSDSLAAAAKSRSAGKYKGIPCEVPHVRRLENRWYTVLFYTDTDWNHCS
jgi:hypothetical protein